MNATPIQIRRHRAQVAGDREAQALAATLGLEVVRGRRAMKLTQAELAERVGIHQSWLGEIERGGGVGAPFGLWIALGIAIGRPLAVAFSRVIEPSLRDAGHLAIQELVLQLAKARRATRIFELQTRSQHSIDIGLRDDVERVLILIEIWNLLLDMGAATRDSNRKRDEMVAAAAADGLRVATCWVVRATAANRALVARHPNVFETAFPGSSRAWVRALTEGGPVPTEPGLVWADVAATRLFEWRRR